MHEPRTSGEGDGDTTRKIIAGLLGAIESRDLRAIRSCLSPDATWQNVPTPAAVGRDAVLDMLAGILLWSDDVRWDVRSAGYEETRCWLERADRFWIDGEEHAVLCNGVFTTDPATGSVTDVRDYVDLGEWRSRISPVLERMAQRPAVAVVNRHLDAVRRRDVVAMTADYEMHAELTRGEMVHRGWYEIVDYFQQVPDRLGGFELTLSEPHEVDDGTVQVRWAVRTREAEVVSQGTDDYLVADGRIVRQRVTIAGQDF